MMIREQRLKCIRQELAKYGIIDGDEIAELLGVSRATIRRDLDALEKQGVLKRTHGGATTVDPKDELPFISKLSVAGEEKREIGVAAAALLPEGSVIGCTGGTTVINVMKALQEKRVTVITNAINVAMELASSDTAEVVVTGGTLRSHSYELIGYQTDETLARFHLDIALIGVDGISLERGISTYTIAEAHTASLYINQAEKVWVVADHSKIGKIAPALIAPLSRIHYLITDSGIPDGQKAELEAAGVRVIIAG
jgi:DeoR/GlpR family transcriptional regulator of sugar metabolism